MAPPKIRLRGLRSPNIPPGYILGRLPGLGGSGEVQLLNLNSLRQFGIAGKQDANSGQTAAGFGFYDGGLLNAGELLGTAIYSADVTFANAADGDTVTSLSPAAAIAVFTLIAPNTLGVPTQVGTVTFAAGANVGTIAWSPNPFLLPKGTALKLFAPSPADLSLADVTGLVEGAK